MWLPILARMLNLSVTKICKIGFGELGIGNWAGIRGFYSRSQVLSFPGSTWERFREAEPPCSMKEERGEENNLFILPNPAPRNAFRLPLEAEPLIRHSQAEPGNEDKHLTTHT